MRNRAKCKLCGDILESFHHHDFVTCKCGEISIDGGQNYFRCSAKSFANFLRIDDQDNEIAIKYVDKEKPDTSVENEQIQPKEASPQPITSKDDLIAVVNEMLGHIERLPAHAQTQPITHYDYQSILLLFLRFLKCN
jgi:hypothetical protein